MVRLVSQQREKMCMVGAGKGKSEIRETVVRLTEKTRELKVRHIEKND